jgi:hypothetical protein
MARQQCLGECRKFRGIEVGCNPVGHVTRSAVKAAQRRRGLRYEREDLVAVIPSAARL